MKITASVVLYKPSNCQIKKLIESVDNSDIKIDLMAIDNSPEDNISTYFKNHKYFHIGENVGFGSGHNIALSMIKKSDIHLILNPDIYFGSNAISTIANFMEKNIDIVCCSPKVIYPDGRLQRLNKLLPTPLNLFSRRFAPAIAKKLDENYELHWFNYDHIVEIPYVSGCFMALRTSAVKEIGGFDKRFFMYLEDTDISRRLSKIGKVIFYPDVTITHEFAKQSYKDKKLLFSHIKSAIMYFNKWGWFFDKERRIKNKTATNKIREQIRLSYRK